MRRIGVDTGGTFTDLLLLDEGGMRVHKLRSTPDDPSRAILRGIAELLAGDLVAGDGAPAKGRLLPQTIPHPSPEAAKDGPPEAVVGDGVVAGNPTSQVRDVGHPKASGDLLEVTHGSTVATNALLERKGARVALLTTAGFEDVLQIGRQTRGELYNFMVAGRRPLIEAGMTLGVRERMGADGSVVEALTEGEIARLVKEVQAREVDAVAVCLLHCYVNAEHERRLAEALRLAGYVVSVSSEIQPEYREFERFATTAVNAYVTPLMAKYLGRLSEGLGETVTLSPRMTLRIMQSNGGSISAETASRAAVQTILSGPAAGVVGAQAVAAESGFAKVISFDMGGTSTDVSLIDGRVGTTTESVVGDFPVRLPVLDIHTVGAGGGSIAYVDSGGSLRVGPRSAGAEPGPACYGKGEEFTVTDANLLLGRLDPEYFLGGRMQIDVGRAEAAGRRLAKGLKMTLGELAEGVVRIANSNMERAVRRVGVERGHDPRGFALLAFGGAGGLHGCELAEALEMKTVLIPRYSGVLSALGMLLADVSRDYSASVLRGTADVTERELREVAAPLEARAREELTAAGFGESDILLEATLAMRYVGQAYEISVAQEPDFREAFHREHQRLYGYANPLRATEVVQLRLKAVGRTDKPALAPLHGTVEPGPAPEPDALRDTVFQGKVVKTPVFHRERLKEGMYGAGPVIVITGESTNVVTPGFQWRVDAAGTLVAESSC